METAFPRKGSVRNRHNKGISNIDIIKDISNVDIWHFSDEMPTQWLFLDGEAINVCFLLYTCLYFLPFL